MTEDQEPVIKPEIDYEKSISKERLCYKMTGLVIFNFILSYIANGLLLLVIIMVSINPANHTSTGFGVFIAFIVLWIVINPIVNNSFVKIKGKNNIADNKREILMVMDEFFSKYEFQINNEQMMWSFKPAYRPIWGRIITILFDEDVMYINITSLGKGDFPTIGHGLWNYLKARRIAAYYKRNFSD